MKKEVMSGGCVAKGLGGGKGGGDGVMVLKK